MSRIFYANQFTKDLKKLKKSGNQKALKELDIVVNKIYNGEKLDSKYRDHKLNPNKDIPEGSRGCHLQFDLILVYKMEDSVLTLLQVNDHHSLKGFKEELVVENIEVHDELNPALWEDNELKLEVKAKILEIVDKFKEMLKEDNVDLDIVDIVLVGSNASYNYTEDSDLDVHIIAKVDEEDETTNVLIYNLYKAIFNDKYDISLKGINVEIYVEANETNADSNGIYSLNNGWLKEPSREDIGDIDTSDTDIEAWEDRYNKVIESNDLIEVMKLIYDIYQERKESIKKDGEYSKGNLTFKEFRNRGYLDNLKHLRDDLIGKSLSLESYND